MKILHLPDNIGGVPAALAACERAQGHESTVITQRDNPFGYQADQVLVGSEAGRLQLFYQSLKAFLDKRSAYDAYHFNFGSSLLHAPRLGLNLADLPFYTSKARKVFTFSGCDARQKYPTIERLAGSSSNAACYDPNCYGGVCNSGRRDRYRQQAIEKAAQHADHFFALNPDLLHFLPREMTSFCPYVIPGLDELPQRQGAFCKNDEFHIVHAPTDRAAKGSGHICAAVQQLQEAFPGRVRYTQVEGLLRDQALQIYASADLMIDQLLIGWYGGVAVEAMKMGVPVACHIEEADLQFVPPAMVADLPIYRVAEHNLFHRLRELFEQREQLQELSRHSQAFVEKWHNPMRISEEIVQVYSGAMAA